MKASEGGKVSRWQKGKYSLLVFGFKGKISAVSLGYLSSPAKRRLKLPSRFSLR